MHLRSALATILPFHWPSSMRAASFRLDRRAATLLHPKNARAATFLLCTWPSWIAATPRVLRLPYALALEAHARNTRETSYPLASSRDNPLPVALPCSANCCRMLERLLRLVRCTAPARPSDTVVGAPPCGSLLLAPPAASAP